MKYHVSNRKSEVTILKDERYVTDRKKSRKRWKNVIKV